MQRGCAAFCGRHDWKHCLLSFLTEKKTPPTRVRERTKTCPPQPLRSDCLHSENLTFSHVVTSALALVSATSVISKLWVADNSINNKRLSQAFGRLIHREKWESKITFSHSRDCSGVCQFYWAEFLLYNLICIAKEDKLRAERAYVGAISTLTADLPVWQLNERAVHLQMYAVWSRFVSFILTPR